MYYFLVACVQLKTRPDTHKPSPNVPDSSSDMNIIFLIDH